MLRDWQVGGPQNIRSGMLAWKLPRSQPRPSDSALGRAVPCVTSGQTWLTWGRATFSLATLQGLPGYSYAAE